MGDGRRSLVASIDQGTSSTRCLIIDGAGKVLSSHQVEHEQLYPHRGWVEHDAMEIWGNVEECVRCALSAARLQASNLDAIGITNQRESTLCWSRSTGRPLHKIIVWNDTRTADICEELKEREGIDRFRQKTGLPIAPYFSATKLMWLLRNVRKLREMAESGDAVFGTLDTWLIWKLTQGKTFITDVSNASRTMLMNLATLQWDDQILKELDIPKSMLPEIRSSSEVYANATGLLEGVPIAGILGDQQAALFGQTCFDPGTVKVTYGTGCFVLMNSGTDIFPSSHGMLSTVAYKLGSENCVYALEGSIAYAGSTVQWLRDNLGMISSAEDIGTLARSVPDNGGIYLVPAFAGLFAPYWRADARGVICGLTAFNTSGHVARAVLESTAFQVKDVLEAMQVDSHVELSMLKVDGGMTKNALLLQFQSDVIDIPVLLPRMAETTALGAAFAAGLAVGVWTGLDQLKATWAIRTEYRPTMQDLERAKLLRGWSRAVQRSLNWVEDEVASLSPPRRKPGRMSAFAVRQEDEASDSDCELPTAKPASSPSPSVAFSMAPLALAGMAGLFLGHFWGKRS